MLMPSVHQKGPFWKVISNILIVNQLHIVIQKGILRAATCLSAPAGRLFSGALHALLALLYIKAGTPLQMCEEFVIFALNKKNGLWTSTKG